MAIQSLQSSETQRRVSDILERYEDMKDSKKRFSNSSSFSWEDAEKFFRFHSETPSGEDAWRSDTVDGWISSTIKTAMSAVISVNPRKQFRPREGTFDFSKVKKLQEIMDYVDEKGNFEMEKYHILLDSLKLGKGFGEVVYLKDEREVTNVKTKKKEMKVEFDDIITRRVSPYFIFIDDMASSMENARDAVKREIITFVEFQRVYGDLAGAEFVQESSQVEEPEEDASGLIDWAVPSDVSDDQVEILHYWNKMEDKYELVVNGVGVAIGRENPYEHKQLPFFDLPFYILSGDEYWSYGIPHIIRKDVEALVKLQNMRIDREKLNIFRPFLYNALETFNKKLFKLEPLMGIPTRDPNNFRDFNFGDVPRSAFLENELIEDNIKRKTGIDERVLGVSSDGRITATEASFLREAALKRLNEYLLLVRKVMLTRESKLKYSLIKQYYQDPIKTEKITTDEGALITRSVFRKVSRQVGKGYFDNFEVSKDLFDQDYDVIIDPISIQPESKATEQNRWGTLLAQTVPLIQQGLVDVSIDRMYEQYLNAFDVDISSVRKGSNEIVPSVFLAEKENEFMSSGKPIPPTPTQFITEEHVLKHKEFVERMKDIGEMSPETEQIFDRHMALEVIAIQKAKEAAEARSKAEQGQGQGGPGQAPPGAIPSPNELAAGGTEGVKQEAGKLGENENLHQRGPQSTQ